MGLLWGILKNKWVACKYFFCFLNIVLCTFPVYTTFLKMQQKNAQEKSCDDSSKTQEYYKKQCYKKITDPPTPSPTPSPTPTPTPTPTPKPTPKPIPTLAPGLWIRIRMDPYSFSLLDPDPGG